MSPAAPPPIRRIAVAGGRGFIGAALTAALRDEGYSVVSIGRSGQSDIPWNPSRGSLDPAAMRGIDAVVNLAGERIDQRWTGRARTRILESRVQSTSVLARTIAALKERPQVLVSMSAMGIYGNRGDDEVDEASSTGSGFLADVVRAWEDAAGPAREAGVRVVHPRTGIVLHPRGGMLARLLPIFRMGAGGRIGDGTQWMSWISLTDTVRGLIWLLRNPALAGAVNLVAPEPVRNEDFTRAFARSLRRPAIAAVPSWAVTLMFGQMGAETILAGQRVRLRRLLESGFEFRFPDLEQALAHELNAR